MTARCWIRRQASAGYDAGIMPGMQLTGVNGGQFSLPPSRNRCAGPARRQAGTAGRERQLVRMHRLDYHGGLRYPHLQRDPSQPDLLREIAAPHVQASTH